MENIINQGIGIEVSKVDIFKNFQRMLIQNIHIINKTSWYKFKEIFLI